MVSSVRPETEEISKPRPTKNQSGGDRRKLAMTTDLPGKSLVICTGASGRGPRNQIDRSQLVQELCGGGGSSSSNKRSRITEGSEEDGGGSSSSENNTEEVGGAGGEERKVGVKETEEEEWRKGWISVIGRRREMEDAVAVEKFGPYRFFAVYDGHGGSTVANACRARLHQLVEEEVAGRGCRGVEWDKAMADSFRKMDSEVCGDGEAEEEARTAEEMVRGESTKEMVNTVGSTAVVVVVGKALVVVANCGDSRAVLCRDGAAVPLSRDHKPDRPDERERVEAAGGSVVNWNGSHVLGILATSRSIGDHYLKPYVISEPEVTVWERTESDRFLVIASDGLWDVMSNDFACEVVGQCFDGQIRNKFFDNKDDQMFGNPGTTASEASALLAVLAIARGSKDNISVVVVDLQN